MVAIVSAAFAVVSFGLLQAGAAVAADALFETAAFERFSAATEQQDLTIDELRDAARDWLDDVKWDRVTGGLLLIAASLGSVVMASGTSIAAMLIVLDEAGARRLSASGALVIGFARVPKFLALFLALAALFAASVALCIALFYVHVALAVAAMIGLFVLWAVFGPLMQMYAVVLLVEPGFASPARWWSLMRGRLAATWGRVVLLPLCGIVVLTLMELATGAAENLYAQVMVDVLAGTVVWILLDVAFALMYVDLTARAQPDRGVTTRA